MKKLLVLFVALLLATSAYAWVDTADNGPQNITTCYIKGVGAVTSGDCVALQTSSPTYPGKEVTGSDSTGAFIYGVVVDTDNKTSEETASGVWVRVQTHGYNSAINVNSSTTGNIDDIAVGDGLVFGSTNSAYILKASGNATGSRAVTTNAVALGTAYTTMANQRVAGFIGGF